MYPDFLITTVPAWIVSIVNIQGHNDAIRHDLLSKGVDPTHFDWASVQLDGGVDRVATKVEQQFRLALDSPVQRQTGSIKDLKIGLIAQGSISEMAARALADLIRDLVL